MLLLTQQHNRWSRRDSKRASQKKYKSDNRKSVRNILNILKNKADKLKNKKEE